MQNKKIPARSLVKKKESLFKEGISQGMRPSVLFELPRQDLINNSKYFWPNTCIGLVSSDFENSKSKKLGCLIAHNVVLVSACIVYDRAQKTYAKNIGFQSNIHENSVQIVKSVHIPPRYIQGEEEQSARWNFSIIQLPNDYVKTNGYLGIKIIGKELLREQELLISTDNNAFQIFKLQNIPLNASQGSPVLLKENLSFKIIGIYNGEKSIKLFSDSFIQWVNPFLIFESESIYFDRTKEGDLMINNLLEPKWRSLAALKLPLNSITDQGVKVLCQQLFPVLKQLNLNKNQVTSEGVKYIIRADFPQIIVIQLSDNEIDNEGIKLISLANWPNLKYLYLKGNKMMNPPIKVLLNSYWPEISVLDIDIPNQILSTFIEAIQLKMPQAYNTDIAKRKRGPQ